MKIEISVNPDFIPVNLLRETARYLNALANDSMERVEDEVETEEVSSPQEEVRSTPPQNSSVELDSENKPWDSRIHSSKRTKTQDGKWKLMRGVDRTMLDQVKTDIAKSAEMPVPPVAEEPETFATFVKKVSMAINEAKLTHAQLVKVLQANGLENLPASQYRVDLLPKIWAELNKVMRGGL